VDCPAHSGCIISYETNGNDGDIMVRDCADPVVGLEPSCQVENHGESVQTHISPLLIIVSRPLYHVS
jgi:hypothetical protein